MRNIRVKLSLICLALLILINIAQVLSVNSEKNEAIINVGATITTTRNEYEFPDFPASGLVNTFLDDDESTSSIQGTANIASLDDNFNITGILDLNVLSANGSSVSNLSISLENPLGTIIVNATTDNDGNYVFKDLDQNETYQIFLVYQGVPYFKDFSFTYGSLVQLNFLVYETT